MFLSIFTYSGKSLITYFTLKIIVLQLDLQHVYINFEYTGV